LSPPPLISFARAQGKKLESLGSTFKIVSDYQTQEEVRPIFVCCAVFVPPEREGPSLSVSSS
jgi:hypothetical protein